MADMLKKLRAYYHFVKRQQKHKDAFGVHPVRAVLIETMDEPRARSLMELAQHYGVIGQGQRASLFWFAISPLFQRRDWQGLNTNPPPLYLEEPQTVLQPLWATPDAELHALSDLENPSTRFAH